MLEWLNPIAEWFGVTSALLPLMMFIIIILLLILIIRG